MVGPVAAGQVTRGQVEMTRHYHHHQPVVSRSWYKHNIAHRAEIELV